MDEDFKKLMDDSDFMDAPQEHNNIKVIGVGGGGGNAVNHMFNQGITGVSFVVLNTDKQDLTKSPVPEKVLIGKTGLGAGNIPEVAREAAESSMDAINAMFDDDTKMVFITAGMGGGTGTGAAPVVARAAKDRGLLTIGIVTIPFLFEGEKKIRKALRGAEQMAKNVDAILVINNERLIEVFPDLNFINGFAKADETLTTAAKSISELITHDGHINVDFNDVNTTLRNGGNAIISTGFGEGEHRVSKAIQDALHSPLLKNSDILQSKKLLFNLYFDNTLADGPGAFNMKEVDELSSFMTKINPEVDVIWGVSFDNTLGEKVKITILAAGFDITLRDRDLSKAHKEPTVITNRPAAEQPAEEEDPEEHLSIEEIYGKDKVKSMQKQADSERYIILSPDQMDDDDAIEAIENNRTFKRPSKVVEAVRMGISQAQQNANNAPLSQRVDPADGQTPADNGTIDFSE